MGVDTQDDLGSGVAHLVVGREWNVDLVPHALHVHHDTVRLLFENTTTEKGNHPAVGGR
jgi:hypothetical protein